MRVETIKINEREHIEKTISSTGAILSQCSFLDNLKHGKEVFYNEDASVRGETNWLNGKKHGEEWSNSANDIMNFKREWKDDKIVGQALYFYANGNIRREDTHSDNGKIIVSKEFYPDGKQAAYKSYNPNEDILTPDLEVKYYPNGSIEYEAKAKDGNRIFEKFYDQEGNLECEKLYYEAGGIKSVKQYDQNQLYLSEEYYNNGQLASTTNFKNGKLHGEAISYWDNGVISDKRNYVNGEKHGKEVFYKIDGSINTINIFEYGNLKFHANSLKVDKNLDLIVLDKPNFCDEKIFQIKAIKDIQVGGQTIKAGTLGGIISESIEIKNNSWIGEDAVITNKSKIEENVIIDGNSLIQYSTIGSNTFITNTVVRNSEIKDSIIESSVIDTAKIMSVESFFTTISHVSINNSIIKDSHIDVDFSIETPNTDRVLNNVNIKDKSSVSIETPKILIEDTTIKNTELRIKKGTEKIKSQYIENNKIHSDIKQNQDKNIKQHKSHKIKI